MVNTYSVEGMKTLLTEVGLGDCCLSFEGIFADLFHVDVWTNKRQLGMVYRASFAFASLV
jgi:hypothetical protein